MTQNLNFQAIFFIGILHLLPVSLFFIKTTLIDWVVCFALYFGRIFFIGAGYHRYFSHKSYETSRIFQAILAFMSQSAMQAGVLSWASNHRIHHQKSDKKGDIHSPTRDGFVYSHIGWTLVGNHNSGDFKYVQDLAKYPELVWLNKHHYLAPTLLGILCFAFGGLSMLVVGFGISTFLLFHGTWTINSLSHLFGSRRYKTTDTSRNNWFLAIITFGEGWHNNHHKYPSSARQGFFWWEYDITYYGLFLMDKLGLIWNLKPVPKNILENKF